MGTRDGESTMSRTATVTTTDASSKAGVELAKTKRLQAEYRRGKGEKKARKSEGRWETEWEADVAS